MSTAGATKTIKPGTVGAQTTSNVALRHIPGDEGWPVLGLMPKYFYSLDRLVQDTQRRFGNVARMRIPGSVGLFVFGADNYQRIYQDKERLFSTRLGYESTLGTLFSGAMLLQDYEDHRVQRRMMQTAFKMDSLREYPGLMNPIIDSEIKSWSGQSFRNVHPLLKNLLLKISSSTFFGIEADDREAEKLSKEFNDLVEATIALLRLKIPGLKYHRGLRARHFLESYFANLVPQRRTSEGKDILSHMCRETGDDGVAYAANEIIDQAIFLLFAAHDTTTSVLNNMLLHLGQDAKLQERLREESMAIGKSELSFDDMSALTGIGYCMDECLRLYPPAPISARCTLRETEVGGYEVPSHTTVYLPMLFNQRDPELWTAPNEFDPERFAPGREEHKNHPFAFHPFGGGAHKCIGLHFAKMMTKCIIHKLLISQRISSPANFDARHVWIPLPRPLRLPVSFTRLR